MSAARLSIETRRRIAADVRRLLENENRQIDAEAALSLGTEWVKPPKGGKLTADYLLVKAVDRFMTGEFSEEELFRCRCIAFYMIFGAGGEEWTRMGVAFGVSMGGANRPAR